MKLKKMRIYQEEKYQLEQALQNADSKTLCMAGSIKRVSDVSCQLLIDLIKQNDWREIYDEAILIGNNFDCDSFVQLWPKLETNNDKLELLTFAGTDNIRPVYMNFSSPETMLFFLKNLDTEHAAQLSAMLLLHRVKTRTKRQTLWIGNYYAKLLGRVAHSDQDFGSLFSGEIAQSLSDSNLHNLRRAVTGDMSIDNERTGAIAKLIDVELDRRVRERKKAKEDAKEFERQRISRKNFFSTPAGNQLFDFEGGKVPMNLFSVIKDTMITQRVQRKF